MTNPLSSGCARVQARLPALVDGALAALEDARDQGHLEACAACRSALAGHERLLSSIRAASALGLASDVALVGAALLERLAPLPIPRPVRLRRAPGPLVAAAAALLLVCVAPDRGFLWRGLGSEPRAVELAGLEPLLEQLPSWSEVLSSLGRVSRWLS